MFSPPRRPSFRRTSLSFSPLLVALFSGCSQGEPPEPASLDGNGDAQWLQTGSAQDPCAEPTSTDCPCSDEGARIACGSVHELRGDYAICSMGARSCNAGVWSECQAEQQVETATTTASGLRLQALSTSKDCKNLCDPRCMLVNDTPDGLLVDEDLKADSTGLTLPGSGSGGHCDDIAISPSTSMFTITGIAANGAITATPASLSFSGTCTGGAPIQPSWTIDAYDRAVLDSTGKLTPFSGIASPIVVTAKSSADSSSALVDVVVKIDVNGAASASLISEFAGAGLAADSGKTLYPYKNTVFPLDLQAPLVQWDTGGNAASEVQVALRYPQGSSSPSFWYSKIYTSGDPKEGSLATGSPAWQIPQEIWSAFDRSVASAGVNAVGEIIVQRRYGTTNKVKNELKIPVKFATKPLYGTVYYTQYRRTLHAGTQGTNYSATSYVPGQTCEVGNVTHPSTANSSMTRAIDLSQKSAPNQDPFNTTAGCPVCHSVSANGARVVSGNQAWQVVGGGTSKGVDTIGLDSSGDPFFSPYGKGIAPTYTGLSDNGSSTAPANTAGDPYNNYERDGENSRGFSYGAISPDGSLVLQGASFWGNTVDQATSNNQQSAVLLGKAGAAKPYFFVNTQSPGVGVQFATTGSALAGASWSNGVFTASANGTLTLDGVTLEAGAAVLVKDETAQKQNGVYYVSSVGSAVSPTSKWVLKRRYDFDNNSEFAVGTEVRVSDGNTNHGRTWKVTAAGTVNSQAITFAEKATPGMAFTQSPSSPIFEVRVATSAGLPAHTLAINPSPATLKGTGNGALPAIDGVTLALNDSILVKDEGTQSHNGIYTVTALGSSSTPWLLKRRSDADETGEVVPLAEVHVNAGTVNNDKVFYVSTPAVGTAVTYTTASNSATAYKETQMPSMMVPVFSPDGTKIAYVNADADPIKGASDTGWRRGLTMMSFDQSTLKLSNKVRLYSTYSSAAAGLPIKWPFFESDSRSLLYVETETGEFCDATSSGHGITVNSDLKRACFEASYGSMSPTTRGYWKGKLMSLDTQNPGSPPTELSQLNDAEDPSDADRSYQPTVLPNSVGGYRWVMFTSPRSYGNQFNQKSSTGVATHFSCAASMLWMAAIDDTTATSSDRSHPAFLVPGQNMAAITTANHYVNERGYLVPTPCKSSGVSCSSNDECCGSGGSNPTAACRAPSNWTPASGPPAKTCAAISGTCGTAGDSCNSPADCCDNTACVNFQCAAPPSFTAASFEREYEADCPIDYQPEWQLLNYYLTAASDSKLLFHVQAAKTATALDAAPLIDLGEGTGTTISPATPAFKDLGAALDAVYSNGLDHLRLTIDFVPSTDKQTAPILHDWEVRYTCQPAQ